MDSEEFYQLFGGMCARCLVNYAICSHHIDPLGHGGADDWDNQIPLCVDCHEEIHTTGPTSQIDDLHEAREFAMAFHSGLTAKR